MRTKLLVIILASLFLSNEAKAQYIFGNTGLLCLPTADMQPDKTAMFGASFLPHELTPTAWDYDTYNYYFNITLLPWLEISYCLALFNGDYLSHYGLNPQHFDHWANQDRDFSIRLRCIKEGQFWEYMPQIVIGANDFLHTAPKGGKYIGFWSKGNGYWGRAYIALTKHIKTMDFGMLAIHAAYMYNDRDDFSFRGIGAGIEYHTTLQDPSFYAKALNSLRFIGEYDSNRINLGLGISVWRDKINIVSQLYNCRYFSAGLQFKAYLK